MKTSIYNVEWHCYRISQDSGLSSSSEEYEQMLFGGLLSREETELVQEGLAGGSARSEPESHHASYEQEYNQETVDVKEESLAADALWKRLSSPSKVKYQLALLTSKGGSELHWGTRQEIR